MVSVRLDRLLPSRRPAEAAGLELRAETAIDALWNAAGGEFGIYLGYLGYDLTPSISRFRACLSAKAAAGDEHYCLCIGKALMRHRSVLTLCRPVLASPVASLRRYEMLYSELMSHEMDAHPRRKVDPLPVEDEFPDGRMLCKEDGALPFGTGLAGPRLLADGSPGGICHIPPSPQLLHEFDLHFIEPPRCGWRVRRLR